MCRLLFTDIRAITKDKFLLALEKMIDGGPDAPLCYYEVGGCKLGHNRLSILDLNPRSNQPFFSADGRYAIIYNGEIYNYKELAREYGIELRTNCDTELILSLSLKIGFKQALATFNGMFAYVIFDTTSKEIFVARDRLGIKPLYILENSEGRIISSEMSAVVELLGGNVQIDETALRQYKKLRTFFNGRTIYKGIQMFPAGCCMEMGRIESYWELPVGHQIAPSDEELKDLIESSVRYRKIADVPLGSYLSGGLDSTIVAALTKELHTWTVGFEDNNEFEWGRLASKRIGSSHHEIVVDRQMFLADAKFMIAKRKEPLSVPNEVLLYEMTKAVKKHNTVILSGEGADELFFGYDRIFRWAASKDEFDLKEFSDLYSYGSNDDLEIVESAVAPFYKYGKPIDVVAAFFQVAHLHGLLRRVDNSTMACSVEARVPFCDHRLVERMAGVPFEYRMQGGIVKAPLKRIFADLIPEEIVKRKKVGFPVSLQDIFHVKKASAFDAWFAFNLENLGIKGA